MKTILKKKSASPGCSEEATMRITYELIPGTKLWRIVFTPLEK